MIYLDSSNIILPNLLNTYSSSYILVVKNNVTNEEFTQDASNLSDNDLYYSFELDSSSMANNEYTITLYDDSSQCLGVYLAQKGINKQNSSVFNNEVNYIQFD